MEALPPTSPERRPGPGSMSVIGILQQLRSDQVLRSISSARFIEGIEVALLVLVL